MAKYCYKLQSCDPEKYEDITNLCLENVVADINDTVYINGDPSKPYVLIYVGVDVCVCVKDLPPYVISEKKCIAYLPNKSYAVESCNDGKIYEVFLSGLTAIIGAVIKVNERGEECFTILKEVENGNEVWTIVKGFEDCRECIIDKPTYYVLIDCKDDKRVVNAEIIGGVNIGEVIKIAELEGCWTVREVAETKDQTLTLLGIFEDCEECGVVISKDFFTVKNCETGESKDVMIVGGLLSVGNVIAVEENNDCWELVAEAETSNEIFTFTYIYRDCKDCLDANKKFYRVESCDKKETNTVQILGGAVQVGDVVTVYENNQGWVILAEVQAGISVWTFTGLLKDCEECDDPSGDCKEDGERTIAYATMVKLPEPSVPDKGFKECCYTNLVLADENDASPYKNDFNGFYFKKQTSGDDCEFILHELATGDTFDLNNDTYGIFKDFGSITGNADLTTFVIEWRKVLAVLGAGLYSVEKNITVAGLSFSMMSNTFTLDKFSDTRADKTIRLDAIMDGTMVHLGVNFKGSDFKTSLRTNGFFGRREPKYKQDNLVKRNYETVQISMSQENEYTMQTGLLPECITEEVYDFLLFGNELFLSDYNLINHSYKFRVYEVEFDTNKGGKYYVSNRDARLNLTFADRVKNKRKINC